MKRVAWVGLYAGLIAGIAAVLLYFLLIALTGYRFVQLNPATILVVSVLVNLIGAAFYAWLRRKTVRPGLHYAWIAIAFGTLLSLLDWAYPPEPHVGDIAAPIHALVVGISVSLIPNRLRRGTRK